MSAVLVALLVLRTGRLDMVRTLLGLGLKLPNKFEIVLAAIESGNMTMFDFVASSGVTIDASRMITRVTSADRCTQRPPSHEPGSIKYVAVSAVGFNAARTKALVYVRFQTSHFSDALLMTELQNGKRVTGPQVCAAVAHAVALFAKSIAIPRSW